MSGWPCVVPRTLNFFSRTAWEPGVRHATFCYATYRCKVVRIAKKQRLDRKPIIG